MVHLCFTYIEYNSALDVSVPGLLSSAVRLYILHHIPFRQQQYVSTTVFDHLLEDYNVFKKNLNASKPSEHPPQVEECLKV